jgi:ribonuclease T1
MRRAMQARWWLLLGLLLCLPFAQARSQSTQEAASVSSIAVSELPAEARDTLQLIKNNGPFPYPRDGVVFGNYERILPQQTRGYYHEYTVKTPGVRHRGARRIVCGILPECYYSADHYRSFKRIQEGSR